VRALGAIRGRPALGVEAIVLAGWSALALGAVLPSGGAATGSVFESGTLWICTTGISHAAGGVGHAGAGSDLGEAGFLAAAPAWALMSGAMMLPAAMPAVRHVSVNSLYWRRRRATVEFVLSFLALWTLFSIFVLSPVSRWAPTRSATAIVAALLVAAAWQLTPCKWRALRACHRVSPLPARGWRAGLGAAGFGLRNGLACLASCWAIMAVVALTGSSTLLVMAAATATICLERLNLRPRWAARRVAVLLAAAALGFAAAALLG
jgi:predicted metal-binding membrane protein